MLNTETKEALEEVNEQLLSAIKYNTVKEWRLSRIMRNIASRFLESAKKNYFIKRLGSCRTVWQKLKCFKSREECGPPTKVIDSNKEITSSRKLSKLFNKSILPI